MRGSLPRVLPGAVPPISFEDGLRIVWARLRPRGADSGIATLVQGNGRLTALIPAGTLAAILFYVHAGGPVMFATWLAAAAFAVATTGRPTERLRG